LHHSIAIFSFLQADEISRSNIAGGLPQNEEPAEKERAILIAIKKAVSGISEDDLKKVFEIIKNQNEY